MQDLLQRIGITSDATKRTTIFKKVFPRIWFLNLVQKESFVS